MKKWLLGILLLIVVILLATPYWFGRMAETQFKQLVNNMPAADKTQFKILSYDRGWFASHVQIQVKLNLPVIDVANSTPGQPGQPQVASIPAQLTLNQTVWHGPLLFVKVPQLGWRFFVGQAYVSSVIEQPDLTAYSDALIYLNGNQRIKLDVKHARFADAAHTAGYDFHDLVLKAKLSRGLNQIEGTMSLGRLDFFNPMMQQHTLGLSGDYRLEKTPAGLYVGQYQMQIQEQAGLALNHFQFMLKNIRFATQSAQANGKLSYAVRAEAEEFSLNNLHLSVLNLALNVDQLDASAAVAMHNFLENLAPGQPVSSVQLARWMELGAVLLQKGLSLKLEDLSFNTPQGRVQAQAQFTLPATTASADTTASNLAMLAELQAGFKVSVPKTLLTETLARFAMIHPQQTAITKANAENKTGASPLNPMELAEQQVRHWLQQGFIVPTENDYQMNLKFQNMQLMINGKRYDPVAQTPSAVKPAPENTQTPASQKSAKTQSAKAVAQ